MNEGLVGIRCRLASAAGVMRHLRHLRGQSRLALVFVAVLAVALAVSAGVAQAKSGSRPIPPPPPDTVVFTLSLAGETYQYTWADVCGDGVLGPAVTQSYLLDTEDQDPELWTGVWLRTVLADVETRSGIVLDDGWKLRVTCVDGYARALWVDIVKDAARNYLLAKDPVEGCTTEDPDDPAAEFYEPTYVRVCTNGDYGNAAFPARLVKVGLSMTVLDSSNREIPPQAHPPLALIVTGDQVQGSESMRTYSGNAYWITQNELAQLAASMGTEGPFTDLWMSAKYSYCEDHGTPVYGYATAAGVSLKGLLADAGLSAGQIAALGGVTVTGSDGFISVIDLRQPRVVFETREATTGEAVDPMLALYRDDAATFSALPDVASTPVDGPSCPTLMYGQITAGESNQCGYVKQAGLVSLPMASPAFFVDAPDAFSDDPTDRQQTNFTLADLVSRGNARRSYTVAGESHACEGLDLAVLLAGARGKICPQDRIMVGTTDGEVDPGLLVADVKSGAYLLAYYSEDGAGAPVANATETAIYGDDLLIADALSLTIEHVDATASLGITSPTVSQVKARIAKGSRLALRPATTKAPGAAAADPVTWKSSKPSVATVAKSGTVTARRTGTVVVTATSGSCTASFTVRVVAKAVDAIKVTLPASRSLSVKSSVGLTARLYPSTATDTITWKSSKPGVARVDRTGRVTGVKKGKATITVRTSNGKTAKCVVTVR